MNSKTKIVVIILVILLAGIIVYASGVINNNNNIDTSKYNTTELTSKLSIDMTKWNYDEENDIYYQIGLTYCTNPKAPDYESLAIYVPGNYFTSTKNEDGTYTCEVNEGQEVGNYTSNNAPIVMPINTPGYSAAKAPTTYSSQEVKDYTDNGIIYVNAGCRGRDNGENYTGGAPWGVTDLKSAVRYIRFNSPTLPGNTENIFTFGHSGGGAQSALMGTTGDSQLYIPYLESIGAAMVDKDGNYISDSIQGAMCWCPITNLDYADEAYEWNMGQYSNTSTRADNTWTKELSNDLSQSYADYINQLGLTDENGNKLTLEESSEGIYNNGSYYDYMKKTIETSLNNFLNDTTFPYTPSQTQMDGQQPIADGQMPTDMQGSPDDGQMPGDAQGLPDDGQMPSDAQGLPSDGQAPNDNAQMDTNGQMPESNAQTDNTTYNNAKEYIDSLNKNQQWITYNQDTNTVNITSIEAFITQYKNPTKDVGAFDDLEKTQAENSLFGTKDEDQLHFDNHMADILEENDDKYSSLEDYNSKYKDEYKNDLTKTDTLNNTIQTRQNMYNPMYYLCDYYEGAGSSKVAKYWRINSGIQQSDTALTTETNLALALNQTNGVESVEFNTVWNQGHTQAERNGTSTQNFIDWINTCLN